MKTTDINAIFSAKVAEFLANGYQINTNTMGGSQGEISKIDFRKGDELIRVLLERKTIFTDHFSHDGIVLIVGRCNDESALNARGFRDAIIWNSHLEIIEERLFYKMGEIYGETDWYLEGKEAEEALKKNRVRRMAKCEASWTEERRKRKEYSGDAIKKILLPAVRRHLEKPKMKAERIDKITRCWRNDRFEYTVTTLGKKVAVLH